MKGLKRDNNRFLPTLLMISTFPFWWQALRLRNIYPDNPLHLIPCLWGMANVIIIPLLVAFDVLWIIIFIINGNSLFNAKTRAAKGYGYSQLVFHATALAFVAFSFVLWKYLSDPKYQGFF